MPPQFSSHPRVIVPDLSMRKAGPSTPQDEGDQSEPDHQFEQWDATSPRDPFKRFLVEPKHVADFIDREGVIESCEPVTIPIIFLNNSAWKAPGLKDFHALL